MREILHNNINDFNCRFSYAGTSKNRLWGQNLEEAMFVYILKWEINYDS